MLMPHEEAILAGVEVIEGYRCLLPEESLSLDDTVYDWGQLQYARRIGRVGKNLPSLITYRVIEILPFNSYVIARLKVIRTRRGRKEILDRVTPLIIERNGIALRFR